MPGRAEIRPRLLAFLKVKINATNALSESWWRERSEFEWCPETESYCYVPFGTRDFKSRASASFAIRALRVLDSNIVLIQLIIAGLRELGWIAAESGRVVAATADSMFMAGGTLVVQLP